MALFYSVRKVCVLKWAMSSEVEEIYTTSQSVIQSVKCNLEPGQYLKGYRRMVL